MQREGDILKRAAPMIRLFLLATLLFALLGGSASAQTPSSKVCDGRFDRFLKGYSVSAAELMPFLHDDAAVDACAAQLDAHRPENMLIAAFLLHNRRVAEPYKAYDAYQAACTQGSRLGCFYLVMFRHSTVTRPELALNGPDADMLLPRISPLLDTDLPVINRVAGMLTAGLLRRTLHDIDRGEALVRRAEVQGDWWATRALEHFLPPSKISTPLRDAERLTLMARAADLGHTPSLIDIARHAEHYRDYGSALFHYRRAAGNNTLLFQRDVAEAQFSAARLMQRFADGTGHERREVRRLLESATALGHAQAKEELARLPLPTQPLPPSSIVEPGSRPPSR